MEEVDKLKPIKKKGLQASPITIIAISFLLLILLGTLLLYMPFTHNEGMSISFLDALFTSTSATCVTGLVPIAEGVAATFNLVGRIILAVLIQLGGLGATTIAVFIFVITSRKLSFSRLSLIKETWNLSSFNKLKLVFVKILLIALVSELIGTVCFFLIFFFKYGYELLPSIGYAVFHSISAFNNAGFDIFGTTSLINFRSDYLFIFLTSLLIIVGGLGYIVIMNVFENKFRFRKFSLHSKVVLTYTLFFIVVGTLFIFIDEIGNGTINLFDSYFMSVSTRTAGFTIYDLSKFRNVTIFVMVILMFVGASPGGTGGGVKTTTIALFFLYIKSLINNKKPHAFKRSISSSLIRRALLIILLGLTFFIIGVTLISLFEQNFNFIKDGIKYKDYVEGASSFTSIDYIFETMSAFGTTGLSTGYTPYFSIGSKIVLTILMFVGRLGPLSISTLFKVNVVETDHFPEENMPIG